MIEDSRSNRTSREADEVNMTTNEHPKMAREMDFNETAWEHIAAKEKGTLQALRPSRILSIKDRFFVRLDATLPPHHRYLGVLQVKRRTLLLAIVISIAAILALIIGLAAGLSSNKQAAAATGETFTGDLTNFTPGPGACGWTHGDGENVVAISADLYNAWGGANPNLSPVCGKMIRATRVNAQGVTCSVDLKVVDKCPDCATYELDASLSAFVQLATQAEGRVPVTWSWLT